MEQVKLKKTAIKILSLVFVFSFAFSLTGCSGDITAEYKVPGDLPCLNDELICENNSLQLLWNSEYQFGYAKNKITNEIISPVPPDFIAGGEYNGDIYSPLFIEYYNISDTFVQTDAGYYCVEDLSFKSEKYENGVKATYYFTEAEITVSLCYELKDDCLYMYVNSDDIYETGTTKILSVSIAPYFCSAPNTESKDVYLFVPVGSGALMYTGEDIKGTAREYKGDVYGTNLSRPLLDNNGNEESIRIPVYGAKNKNSVNMGIISQGDNSAAIRALAGDVNSGYSCVYPIFTVRDYVNTEWDTGTEKNGKEMYLDTVLINETIPKNKFYGINLYSVHAPNASYADIAQKYKEYSEKNGFLKASSVINADYNLELLGGVSLKAYTLGLPHRKLNIMTDFAAAESILSELSDTSLTPNVVLNGFGKSGLTPSKIGDSFTCSSKYGKIGNLKAYADANNINIQFNLNLLTYSQSGGGFNFTFDAASGANGESIHIYPQKVNVRVNNEEERYVHVLEIDKIGKACGKAVKFLQKYELGFYSDNFGSTVFSDCTNTAGMLGGSVNVIEKELDSIKKSGNTVVLSLANAYCAGLIDAVTRAPVSNGNYQCFDEYIPFYEYVFGGYTRLYGPSLNICSNKTDILLKCIEGGVYPSFTIANKVDVSLIDSTENYLYACSFDGNKEYIKDTLNAVKDYYSAIKGAHITNHKILVKGVTETVFSNGTHVIVNHTQNPYTYNKKVVEAYSYTVNSKGDSR